MDKNSYTMTKFGLESKDILNSNEKGCGFYLRYFFFFVSLIQFLIILGLVLFMVYGNAHGATEAQLQLFQKRFSECHDTTSQLMAQSNNLAGQLKNMTDEKNRYSTLYHTTKTQLENCNASSQSYRLREVECKRLLLQCDMAISELKNCRGQINAINATCFVEKFQIEKKKTELQHEFYTFRDHCAKNMSDLVQKMQTADSERTKYRLETINVRNEKKDLKTQLEKFQESCTTIEKNFKEELQNLHQTITSIVERALPSDLFSGGLRTPTESQLIQRCSPLSDQVQHQINMQVKNIRDQIHSTLKENGRLQAMRDRNEERLRECEETKTSMAQMNERAQEALQARWDEEMKKAINNEQKLKDEKVNLAQQLEEKSQKLSTAMVQMEQCQKRPAFPPINPFNPLQRIPVMAPKPGGNFDQLRQAIQNFGR